MAKPWLLEKNLWSPARSRTSSMLPSARPLSRPSAPGCRDSVRLNVSETGPRDATGTLVLDCCSEETLPLGRSTTCRMTPL